MKYFHKVGTLDDLSVTLTIHLPNDMKAYKEVGSLALRWNMFCFSSCKVQSHFNSHNQDHEAINRKLNSKPQKGLRITIMNLITKAGFKENFM